MAANKTQPTIADVDVFLAAVADPGRRADAHALVAMLARLSGEPAVLWGPSIIGFGRYRYRHAGGRTGEMPRIGFAPRKAELVLYFGAARRPDLLAALGRHRVGGSCLYIKRLADVDVAVLEALARSELAYMDETYPRNSASAATI